MGRSNITLRPFDVVARAHTQTRGEFVASYQRDYLLLVSLLKGGDAVYRALMECPTDAGMPWYPRSESTGTGTAIVWSDLLADLAPQQDTYPPDDGSALNEPISGRDLAPALKEPHFVMPLRKRPGALVSDPERISVGRSHANDIVLFHTSVSKLHAWLEYDDRERLYVRDANSTNGTRVGALAVDSDELVHFQEGEVLQFGDVRVRVAGPGLLWDAIHEGGGD